MKTSKLVSVILFSLCALLGACGGGGGGSSPSQPPAPVAKPVLIDAEGDSTMWGLEKINGAYVRTANTAPVVLQSLLQKQFGKTVTVENNGQGGATVVERMNGTTPYTAPYVSDGAKIVIGNWDINDTVNESISAYQATLISFVINVRAGGGIAVLEEPNPVVGSPAVGDYSAAMDEVAAQMNVPIITQYAYIQALAGWQDMLTDGIHPNDALYAIKAQREEAVIGPLVAKLQ